MKKEKAAPWVKYAIAAAICATCLLAGIVLFLLDTDHKALTVVLLAIGIAGTSSLPSAAMMLRHFWKITNEGKDDIVVALDRRKDGAQEAEEKS